jgi:hypothetical protein
MCGASSPKPGHNKPAKGRSINVLSALGKGPFGPYDLLKAGTTVGMCKRCLEHNPLIMTLPSPTLPPQVATWGGKVGEAKLGRGGVIINGLWSRHLLHIPTVVPAFEKFVRSERARKLLQLESQVSIEPASAPFVSRRSLVCLFMVLAAAGLRRRFLLDASDRGAVAMLLQTLDAYQIVSPSCRALYVATPHCVCVCCGPTPI